MSHLCQHCYLAKWLSINYYHWVWFIFGDHEIVWFGRTRLILVLNVTNKLTVYYNYSIIIWSQNLM